MIYPHFQDEQKTCPKCGSENVSEEFEPGAANGIWEPGYAPVFDGTCNNCWYGWTREYHDEYEPDGDV